MRDLALLFLRLGATAFGGPAAHIAMMEEEVVRRRGWLTHEELLNLLGAANLIPGPNSTELAIHIGYRRGGWRGLIVAGVCFILPAALIVTAIAWVYVRYAKLPQAEAVLAGIKPVIIAIIAHALWRLGMTAMKSPLLIAATIVALVAAFLGVHELIVLFGIGVLIAMARTRRAMFLVPIAGIASAPAVGLLPLFLFFLKVGSVLFGSGYVLIAFLRADLVERWHWLTEAQLLDAVAVGQITPGPLFTTATFIGYVLGGAKGAVVATLGIFLPAFVFVAISGPLVPRLRRSKVAAAFLDGVNAATVALMTFVTWQLARAAIVDIPTIALAVGSVIVLLRFPINSVWLIAIGGIVGLIIY
ncbi:MAG TPA: chromate efflux transporter [Thermoanaerobaculia bacterium]|nr:chromate efflux transporter [Thermoanaerobaculia bacterium]